MKNFSKKTKITGLRKIYDKDGYLSPIDIITKDEAKNHRNRLELAENKIGSLHYKSKVHTIIKSAYELATNRKMLDIVEKILGPNILLYNVTYIIKEPKTMSHVSWHQDLTYWGFSHDDQVSAWLALSEASELSGAMKMMPGSHKQGKKNHEITHDKNNVLLQGQTVKNVDEKLSVLCPLKPGQASFHHGWTLHTSKSNNSSDRRIGLNIQYIATQMRQMKNDTDTAICVRGEDKFNFYQKDEPARIDLDIEALDKFKRLDEQYKKTAS